MFEDFECDRCGECCRQLLVEAYWIDAEREPKLYQISNHPVTRPQMREGSTILLWDQETRECPFLKYENTDHTCCEIHDTRPTCCVAVEAGDAKCQQARLQAGRELLADRNGNTPTEEMMRDSCEEYELDFDEVFRRIQWTDSAI